MSYLDSPGPFHRGDGGALLISVAGGCFATLLGMFALGASDPAAWHPATLMIGLVILVVMSLIGTVVAVAIGLPLTLLLERYNWERPWVYPVAGSLAGSMTSVLIIDSQGDGLAGVLGAAAFGFFPGGLTGLNWWFLHRRHFQGIGDISG